MFFKYVITFQFKMLCVKSIWGRRVEEIGVSVNVAKLFSNQEKDHLQLLADLVDKSIVDPAVQCKSRGRFHQHMRTTFLQLFLVTFWLWRNSQNFLRRILKIFCNFRS